MGDPGPSSGGLPSIGPHTSNFLSTMFASSAPTQPEAIVALPSTNTVAPSLAFDRIQVTGSSPQVNGVLSVRIDTRIKLLVSFRPGSPVQCLKIPKTPSVHGECPTPAQSLKFSLELKGAGSEVIIRSICEKCKERKDQATWDMVDFRAPTTIISIQDGTASIEFSIKCYARHHGKEHFCADAILRDHQDNIIDRTRLSLLFHISGKGKPVKPRRAQQRAVRGVTAQYYVPPCIIPVVPPSVNPLIQDPQRLDNGTVQEWTISHLGNPTGEYLQTSNSDQQPSWADTAAGILGATNSFLWYTPSTPVDAPPLSRHAVQPSELRSSSTVIGSLHHLDLPLESNSNPVVFPGTRTSAPPHGEQVLPVMPHENESGLRSLGPTSGEPQYGSMNQASSVPEATSQILSQNLLGIPQALNTSSAVPSGRGTGAPDISTLSEPSRLQAESSVHSRNAGIDQIAGEALLEEVVPKKGPTTGRIEIVLFGENFPAVPLYVLFGDNWARARRYDARILRCCLPPSAHPGVVNVTLSQTPSKNAPEVGWSIATFEYEESRPESLLSLLKTIYQLVDETTRQKGPAQTLPTMNTHRNPSWNMHTTQSNNPVRDEVPTRLEEVDLEDISIRFLCTYSTQRSWRQIISTCNEYGQTLAHIAVTSGYFRLLQHLVGWQIDLNAVDSTGLTALHYAYLFKQEECAKFLIHLGVDQFILDDLGRSPSDLDASLEVRLRSNTDMDGDISSAGGPIECDTEMSDEAGKLYEKPSLVQQWMPQGEDERRGMPLSTCQSQETSSPPAPDPADGSIWHGAYNRFSSLDVRTPEEYSAPVVAEEIDVKAFIEIVTPPNIAHPPSPFSEFTPQTQEVNRPSDTGQNPFSHPTPLGETPNLEDPQFYRQIRAVQPLAGRELSLVSTTRQGHLPLSDTSGDIKEENDVNDEKLLKRSNRRPESVSAATSPREERREGPHIDPTDAIAVDNARKEVWKYLTWQPYDDNGLFIGSAAAMDIAAIEITVPSSIGSHFKSTYHPQHHFASSTHEDTAYTGLPPRPSFPILTGCATSGYLLVGTSDEEEVDITHYPATRSDALNHKMKHGTLPATPTSSSDSPRPQVELRAPLLQTDVASRSTRPRPRGPQPQPQPHPQSQSQPRIHLNLQPPPEPPKTKSLALIIVPPPSHPPPKFPAVENISEAPFYDPYSANHSNNQPPDALVGPATTEGGANTSLKSQTSSASMGQLTTNPFAILTSPSINYGLRPRPMTKTTDAADRSHTWHSNVKSMTISHQYSMDSSLPSSRVLSHGAHGDEKDPATNSNSPVNSLSPKSITPSTGRPTSSWEFPLPPGAPALRHTRSDPASVARPPRPRTKSTLSNIVATAVDIQVKNRGVAIPMVSMAHARPMAESLHSDSPNGAIRKGSKSGLMTTELQVRARKPIPPDFFDNPEAEQKKSESWTDMHGEMLEMDFSLLSGIPMVLAGRLKENGSSTERQADEPTGNPTQHRRQSGFAYRESSNTHTSYVTDDDDETLERAEIKAAELAIRSPLTSVPQLARWDTIRRMSDPKERFRTRWGSGSNATAIESTRKRKSPDDSPAPMPRLPIDVKEWLDDSLDLSSRGSYMVEGQLGAIPMSPANCMSPLVPWTPSPAATPLRLDTMTYSASSQYTAFDSSGSPPWQPLRLRSPPRDEQHSPSTPPPVPPIPELAPISFDDLIMWRPPIQKTDESPALVEERTSQADTTVFTVHEESPPISSEASESEWQPGYASDSSIHSRATTDIFGLSATESMRGVPRRGPRALPRDREPSGSGASITSMSRQNTGSHGTSGSSHGASGSWRHNDGYAHTVDYVFGLSPRVLEQPERDTSPESHVTVPAPRKLPQKIVPVELMTQTSPPTSASSLPRTNVDTPFSSRTSVAPTMSGLTTRPQAGSTRPGVGVVRGPRDRSSSVRRVLSSFSSSSRGYSANQSLPLPSSSVPASHAQPSSLTPDNAAGSPKPKRNSTISNNSLLDLYAQKSP